MVGSCGVIQEEYNGQGQKTRLLLPLAQGEGAEMRGSGG